jgi:hypothetical protein
MASDVDAKGDIFAGTADNAVSRLAVGTNDYVLTADSAEATGLKWAEAAAGGGGGGVDGITSTADATAITIDSSENVTINDGWFRVDNQWMGDLMLSAFSLAVCVLGSGGPGIDCDSMPWMC